MNHASIQKLVLQPSKAPLLQRFVALAVCLALLFISGCQGNTSDSYVILKTYQENQQYYPEEHWSKLAVPELAGWSSAKLERAREFSQKIHSAAVVIIENGVIVAEWGKTATRYKLHSVRKSIMDIMIGTAVDNNQIKTSATLAELGITDKGGLTQSELQATVHDLLTSRSGIYHPAAYETPAMDKKRPSRGSHTPGAYWFYNNWDFNALLTIYQQQTKKDFFQQFEETISTPLQMEQFRPEDTSYYNEPDVSDHSAYLFRMSALDLARFGLLCLREGAWKQHQIVSADWIKKSTQPYTVFNPKNPKRGYGYLWWIDEGMYYAAGTGGQRLFVVPEYNLIIVHRTDTDSNVRIKSKPLWQLFSLILEARDSDAPASLLNQEPGPTQE